MEQNKLAEINSDKSKTGVVYITNNENMFIAPEGISDEEYKRISLETDINAMKEKIEKMQKDLSNMTEPAHEQKIERTSPFTAQSSSKNEDYLFKYKTGNFKNIVIFDTETTGTKPYQDELLQFSAVDINGNELMNTYIHPERHKEWPDAMKKNHITPEMVENSPKFSEVRDRIQNLLNNADLILTYNGKFDMDFLQRYGVKINHSIPLLDVMKAYTDDYKKHTSVPVGKPYLNLEESAKMINFSYDAHNSLGDSKATLKLAQTLYGQNLEKLTLDDINEFTENKALPVGLDRKSPEYWKMLRSLGSEAINDKEVLSEIMKNPKEKNRINLINRYMNNPDDRKTQNKLINSLGRYVADKNPEIAETFFKNQADKEENRKIFQNNPDSNVLKGLETIPAFSLMTKNGMKNYDGMHLAGFLDTEGMYLLDNGKEQLKVPVKTFESIMDPQKAHPVISNAKTVETAEEAPAIVNGVTVLPEFAMITTNGIETFKDLKVDKFNAAENSYTLKNGDSTIVVTGETFSEIIRPDRFDKQYDENGPAYEKLINSQYENYFKQRDNTANNFRHNLSVYCRKEANSPLDALTISKEIISRMNKEEKEKTRLLLNQIKKEDETINQLLVRTYYEAIKEVPLDKEKVLNQKDEKMIAKPFYDTINGKGQPVDENSNLKIGDTVKDLAFNIPNAFGHGKTKIFEDLTVISSSKEGNNVILMDKNRSFYEVPRDSLLEGYNKQHEKHQKTEMKQRKSNRIDVGWER